MSIKCPICGAEHEEGTIKFCTVCMYSIGSDAYLTNLLNHPSEGDLRIYNDGIEEYRALWRERNLEEKKVISGLAEMVEVEGGTFMMGSNEGRSNEKPAHKVTIGSYLIGKYEVTQELWESIMMSNPSNFKGSKRPVEKVSWYDAIEFCNKLSKKEGLEKAYSGNRENINCDFGSNGYRLPTEAEWEYAARGGNKSRGYEYSGSDNVDEVARYWDYSGITTHEVGAKLPNELGLYDMSGNVWEWCWDEFVNYNSPQMNAGGHGGASSRVNRGGSWLFLPVYCRVACRRSRYTPNLKDEDLGFRVVRTKK